MSRYVAIYCVSPSPQKTPQKCHLVAFLVLKLVIACRPRKVVPLLLLQSYKYQGSRAVFKAAFRFLYFQGLKTAAQPTLGTFATGSSSICHRWGICGPPHGCGIPASLCLCLCGQWDDGSCRSTASGQPQVPYMISDGAGTKLGKGQGRLHAVACHIKLHPFSPQTSSWHAGT